MEANTLQAKDLRIGNKLQDDEGNIYTVRRLSKEDEEDILIEEKMNLKTLNYDLFGVPLSEDILLKLGFQRFLWGLVKGELLFKDKIQDPCKELTLEVGNGFRTNVTFLHELQNLYFALTNLELTIKE